MRVAVTAAVPTLASTMDPRFGRARHFVVVDTDTGSWTAHDNAQNLNAPQGAGIQAAQCAAELGVEAVVTGNVGPKAYATLCTAGIAVYLCGDATVAEAVERLKAGALERTGEANVAGHW